MCGIVAEHGRSSSADNAELERMLERIAHRGPDDRGFVEVDGSWLGHRRLSIVDVEGGDQPLRTPDDDCFLVGNGEVYNHEDVRSRLEGREILTSSDNEVALHLIDEYGPEALRTLNGMSAFCLATTDGRFLAARVPVGIKPLYWTTYTAAEALESLPGVVRAIESFDPGLVRSAVPNYLLARMTRQHVKVVLTGEGADELFAGYDYLREFRAPAALHTELVRIVRSLHNLNLQRCDRVTMAHAVEARVPFLDKCVIEWALRVPASAKLARPGEPEKRLLREAFDGWLPGDLLWRGKGEVGGGRGGRGGGSGARAPGLP